MPLLKFRIHYYIINAWNVLLFIFMQFIFLSFFLFTVWLHFKTAASLASEELAYKGCIRDTSVRKTDEEKSNACLPSDALNLLADLALSASYEQLPPADLSLERKAETNLKKCDLIKDATAEQKSVLRTLGEPAAEPIQPVGSPSPSHLLEGSEIVSWISKEHAYSLPPSSSLRLDLPSTSLQASLSSGSTSLLRHPHLMHRDGIKLLHPTVDQRDGGEDNRRTPENPQKHTTGFRRFGRSRTFVTKDRSLFVTKQWKESYDFSRDAKFTNDPKSTAIIRALHGYVYSVMFYPWNVNISVKKIFFSFSFQSFIL